jgi:HD domain
MSLAMLALTLVAGAMAAGATSVTWGPLALGAGALALAQFVSVPAPSGERLHLGVAVAAAVPLLTDDYAAVTTVYAFGMAGSLLFVVVRGEERREDVVRHLSDVLATAVLGVVFFGISALRDVGSSEWGRVFALAAAGVAWYGVRAILRSLVGFERRDLAPRYLWLLALEDWAAVVSLFIAGALFGLAWPVMGAWALPMAAMPYTFSHLAFVRYNDTRLTYRQMIRALGQIPEVAGLAPTGHASRTAELSVAIARELGIHPDAVVELEYAALMHDVGRITLNEPAILRAGYTDEDIARWGAQIIAEAPHLARVAELVRAQYRPYRLAGQQRDETVPLSSKIIKAASAYDDARHEMGLAAIDALERVHRGSAYDFDPEVAASLRRVLAHRGEIEAR